MIVYFDFAIFIAFRIMGDEWKLMLSARAC